MTTLKGIPASSGAALGSFFLLTTQIPVASPLPSQLGAEQESAYLNQALASVGRDLLARADRTEGELHEILVAVAEMATDPAIAEEAITFIENGHSASYAIFKATEIFQDLLTASGGYLAERVSDVVNIRNRVLCEIAGTGYPEIPHFDKPVVLIAQDLSPADTADLKAEMILAIVTAGGGPTSHTAIIARAHGIAAVVACDGVMDLARKSPDALVAVDATAGSVVFNPSLQVQEEIGLILNKIKARKSRSVKKINGSYTTQDGVTVEIYANIGRVEDAAAALKAGADGVGLLRTELLYLDRVEAPTIEQQISIYTQIFTAFEGQKVVIRTLDAGADKPMAFINFAHEPNPALGVRGYRTAKNYEDLLRTQLEAIAISAKRCNTEIWVMAPMIALPSEATEFINLAREYGLQKVGIMIEVPSAIFHIDELTTLCDFVSIGTNDLGQYLHAADRESAPLAAFNDPWQPALLRAVKIIAQAGLKNNCPVGVCGEAASDPALAAVLIGSGVSSVSCSPATLPDVAAAIAAQNLEILIAAADVALRASDAVDAKRQARAAMPALIELGL